MVVRYFAYGSNLKSSRLRARAPSARPEGAAFLSGYRLCCDKRGADGTGKANLHPAADSSVWGAIYALDPDDWPALDAYETGYERLVVELSSPAGPVVAQTYRSVLLTPDPMPLSWYKQLIVEGAREHALPDAWICAIEAWPVR